MWSELPKTPASSTGRVSETWRVLRKNGFRHENICNRSRLTGTSRKSRATKYVHSRERLERILLGGGRICVRIRAVAWPRICFSDRNAANGIEPQVAGDQIRAFA